MRFLLFVCLFSPLIPISLHGQYIVNYGDVPQSDLLMTSYPKDSSASAVVLYDRAIFVADAEQYTLRHHRRVKLLRREAFDQAEIVIPYIHESNREIVQDIRAHTVLPDGRIVEIPFRDMIRRRIDDTWSQLQFTFPQLEPGAVLEYQYDLTSQDITVPRRWLLRETIPVRFAQLTFENQSPYSYRYFADGISHLDFTRDGDRRGIYRAGDMQLRVDGTEFTLLDSPGLQPEPFTGTLSNYLVSIQFQLSEYISNGSKRSFLSTWEELAKELMSRPDFGDQLLKSKNYKAALAAARAEIPAGGDFEATLAAIRQFVARRIKWTGENSFLSDKDLDDAFLLGQGKAAEIQLLGIALLREFGFEAHPVLTSTREHGALNQEYPMVRQFNYVFAALPRAEGILLVDFLDPNLPTGLVRAEALNHYGLLVREKAAEWLEIRMKLLPDIYFAQLEFGADGTPLVTVRNASAGYSATADRTLQSPADLYKVWQHRLHATEPEAVLDSVWREDATRNGQLTTYVRYRLPEEYRPTEAIHYLVPLLAGAGIENPFQAAERELPVDLVYPRGHHFQFVCKIPEGYEIAELPKSRRVDLNSGGGNFTLDYQDNGKQLIVKGALEINQTYYLAKAYPKLRAFYLAAIRYLEEPVVLRRKS